MRAKDNPAVPGIGSGPYGAEPGFSNDDCVPEYGSGSTRPDHNATRDRFREMNRSALQSLKAEMELHRRNLKLQGFVRDDLEQKYQAILHKQAEWDQRGFWTEENEKKFREWYKMLN